MVKRWVPNWFDTCWLAMLSRSAWMVAWLMVSLKTQTSGPKAATFAPGQIDESALASWDGAAAKPAAAARAATTITGRRSQRTIIPLVIDFIRVTFAPQPLLRASPQGVSRFVGHSLVIRREKPAIDDAHGHLDGKRPARITRRQGRRLDDHLPCDIPETTSALNLAVTLLTRHKHHCLDIKKTVNRAKSTIDHSLQEKR